MQLQGSGVSVSIGFPADMRGASYAQEELIKVWQAACLALPDSCVTDMLCTCSQRSAKLSAEQLAQCMSQSRSGS